MQVYITVQKIFGLRFELKSAILLLEFWFQNIFTVIKSPLLSHSCNSLLTCLKKAPDCFRIKTLNLRFTRAALFKSNIGAGVNCVLICSI